MVLQKMRAGAQGLLAKVLVGLIVFVLAVTGFGAIQFFSGAEPVAASVNGDDITQRVLDAETQRLRAQRREELGPSASDELLDRLVNRSAVLESLIVQKLMSQFANELDLSISERAVQQRIRDDFAAFGGFDEASYRRFLANIGHTPSSYQAERADREVQSQVASSVGETSIVTTRDVRHSARILRQRRDIAYLLFDVESLSRDVEVDDAQVERYYGEHLDDFMTEERFYFDYVRLRRDAVGSDIEVAEEDIEVAYRDEIAGMPTARRRAAHILLEINDQRGVDEATATLREVRDAVEGGADFAERARELSEDPATAADGGDLGFVGRGVFPAAMEDALWGLEPGGMSLPVQTEFGVHLVKLLEVETIEIPTLEERRDQIVADLRRSEVDRRFAETAREMDEIAFEESDSLDGLASTYGLEVERLDGVTRSSSEGVLVHGAVRQEAFGDEVLVQGYNSEAITTPEEVLVIRLRSRDPSTEKPLDDVREEIRDTLARERARALAEQRAFDALTRFADGATPTELASETGREWQRADAVERTSADVPEAILALAFEMNAPAPGDRGSEVATLVDGSRALVLLSNVSLGDYEALTDDERGRIEQSLKQLTANQDLSSLVRTLRAEASVSAIDFGTEDTQ